MPRIMVTKPMKAKKGTLKRLVKELFTLYPKRLLVCAFLICFNAFANLSSSIFTNFITVTLSNALTQGPTPSNPFVGSYKAEAMGITINTNVTVLLIILGCIYGFGVFAAWWWARQMAIITQDYLNIFRKKMFNHMQDLPIRYFDTHSHGNIMSIYTNDIDTIRQFISSSMPEFLRTSISVLLCLTAMLMNSVWMTLVVIACAVLMLCNTKFIGGKSAKFFKKQQEQVGVVEGNIQEAINGLKVIKVFSHEEKSSEEFSILNDKLGDYSTKANMFGNITMPINGNIGNLMYVLTATMGFLILVTPGFWNLTLTSFKPLDISSKEAISTASGMVVSFLLMSRMFTNNVSMFSEQVIFIVMGMAGASRCYDIVDEPVEEDNGYVTLVNIKYNEDGTFKETSERTRHYAWKHPHKIDGSITYQELKGDILLDKVDFWYNKDVGRQILNDVSIYAHPGQKIALVGATGAGKTTITNLLNRFYPIADGKIRYDGININKIKKDDLRRSLGIVLQDVNLFTGTVLDNIRYGRLDATDEECMEAAKIANAYDFITRLPNGFNTMLTGDGANLSQGQRQLLSIARAAVADTPVMILDEATSSIDTRTEKLVQDGMDKLMEGRTVFVIAHRLSTVQNSDCIIVLNRGEIIERGNHESLLEDRGTYYQLYTGAFELE